MVMMKRKFNRSGVKEYKILLIEEDTVLIEFPGFMGSTKEELELITQDLIKTVIVYTVGGVFVDGSPIDLFDRKASKEARVRARVREKEINQKLGISDVNEIP